MHTALHKYEKVIHLVTKKLNWWKRCFT